jgi:glycosyl transferase family 25
VADPSTSDDAPPIYLINLAHRRDRLAKMHRRLDAAGLAYTVVEAIDGRAADPMSLGARFARPGWFGPVSSVEQACGLSHLKALARFLGESGAAHAVVLEDDVRLAAEAGPMLRRLGWLAPQTQLLKLERERQTVLLGRPARLTAGSQVAPLLGDHSGAAAYIVSRSAAAALLALSPIPMLPFDYLLFHRAISPIARRLRPLQLVPALAQQDDRGRGDSDIEPSRTALTLARTRPRGLSKLRREFQRILRQANEQSEIIFAGARRVEIGFDPAADPSATS